MPKYTKGYVLIYVIILLSLCAYWSQAAIAEVHLHLKMLQALNVEKQNARNAEYALEKVLKILLTKAPSHDIKIQPLMPRNDSREKNKSQIFYSIKKLQTLSPEETYYQILIKVHNNLTAPLTLQTVYARLTPPSAPYLVEKNWYISHTVS